MLRPRPHRRPRRARWWRRTARWRRSVGCCGVRSSGGWGSLWRWRSGRWRRSRSSRRRWCRWCWCRPYRWRGRRRCRLRCQCWLRCCCRCRCRGWRCGGGLRRRRGRPRSAYRMRVSLHGFRFGLADRIFERQPLAGNIAVGKRRIGASKLVQQGLARAVINPPSGLAGIAAEAFEGTRQKRLIVCHRYRYPTVTSLHFLRWPQDWNGFWTRMVSSRSGLVDSSATGQPINSSTCRTYLIAAAGSSAHVLAPWVEHFQPSNSS